MDERLDTIAGLAVLSAALEASAEKPGNVTPTRGFADTRYEDFLLGALALAQGVRKAAERGFSAGSGRIQFADVGVGRLIRDCVSDVLDYSGAGNTHLGVVTLFVPVAAAAGSCLAQDVSLGKYLRSNIRFVVENSTAEDSAFFYEAVKTADAGGIRGELEEPDVPFHELMRLSASVDRVSEELSSGLSIVFRDGVPEFNRNRNLGGDTLKALVQTYLFLLSRHPDTLVAKRCGRDAAEDISKRAAYVLALGGVFSPSGMGAVREFDYYLRSEDNSRNPGTTADLCAASLFVWLLEKRL